MVIVVSTWHLFHSIRSKALVNRKFERHRTMKCGYLPLDRADCYGANSGPSERFWKNLRQVNQCQKGQNFAVGIVFSKTQYFIVRIPCIQNSALPAFCLWNRWPLQGSKGFFYNQIGHKWDSWQLGINFASFRTFKTPLYHKQETFLEVWYSDWALGKATFSYVPSALDLLLQQLLHQVEEP